MFALFDKETRQSLRDVVKGQADTLRGRGVELRKGIHYLNPALSTGSRLFEELTRDEPLLKRFVIDSAALSPRAGRAGATTSPASSGT